jgi:hypothetical protein
MQVKTRLRTGPFLRVPPGGADDFGAGFILRVLRVLRGRKTTARLMRPITPEIVYCSPWLEGRMT